MQVTDSLPPQPASEPIEFQIRRRLGCLICGRLTKEMARSHDIGYQGAERQGLQVACELLERRVAGGLNSVVSPLLT